MFKKFLLALGMVALFAITGGCDLTGTGTIPPPTDTPTVAGMLPELAGYNTVEGQLLTDYIATLSEGAALLSGHPELAATIAAVDGVISCYQDVGAVRARVYSQEEDPLAAGAVAIGDRNELLDPANLFNCLLLRGEAQDVLPSDIEPCSARYTLEKDDNTFYILYAATKTEVCQAFCTNLEGCTAHP